VGGDVENDANGSWPLDLNQMRADRAMHYVYQPLDF
jgi:hypothetical protein